MLDQSGLWVAVSCSPRVSAAESAARNLGHPTVAAGYSLSEIALMFHAAASDIYGSGAGLSGAPARAETSGSQNLERVLLLRQVLKSPAAIALVCFGIFAAWLCFLSLHSIPVDTPYSYVGGALCLVF